MDIVITLIIIVVLVYVLINYTGKKKSIKDNPGAKEPARMRRKASYGKWVGGGLGWAFGGPIGAILGFTFGSMYDGMQSGSYEYQSTRRGDFSVSLLILAAAVMKADGKVMRSELNYVRTFFARQFGADQAAEQIKALQEILKQQIQVQEVAGQIRQFMEYPSRLQLIHFLFGISQADNHYHPKEVDMIEIIARYLGISSNDFASIKAMFVKDTEGAYKILEISPNASNDEVKQAYRKMAVKYHPDKVAHLGADVQKAAKEKFQNLNAAYEEIKKERGIN
jgi:DnaJ like chaperone protein